MHQNEELRAVTANLLFFLIKYADLGRFHVRRRRSLLLEVSDNRNEDAKIELV